MKAPPEDVRMDVALTLYNRYKALVSRRDHTSEVQEELDHALTLVLKQPAPRREPGLPAPQRTA